MAVISVEVPDRLSVGIQKDTVIDFDTLEEMMSIIARDEKLE
jgi:hypothetical protein